MCLFLFHQESNKEISVPTNGTHPSDGRVTPNEGDVQLGSGFVIS